MAPVWLAYYQGHTSMAQADQPMVAAAKDVAGRVAPVWPLANVAVLAGRD